MTSACCLSVQDEHGAGQAVTARSQPFSVAHTAAAPGPCRASVTLHLVDAIAEGMRTVKLNHTVYVLPRAEDASRSGAERAAKRQKRGGAGSVQRATFAFRTQKVEYRNNDTSLMAYY